MSVEAMKLALEALKQIDEAMPFPVAKFAMQQLRQAIEQAQPVAWMDEFGNVFPLGAQRGPKYLNEPMKPLYTAPPQRQPLTDEQIEPMFKARQKLEVTGEKDAWYFYAWGVNDGEAAHGITKENT